MTIVLGSTQRYRGAQPAHRKCGLRGQLLVDHLGHELVPLLGLERKRVSNRCNTFFKKAISMVCWPILRSNSATVPLSEEAVGPFANARSPSSKNFLRHLLISR